MKLRMKAGLAGIAFAGTIFVGLPQRPQLAPQAREFVKVDAPMVALIHARVIDGNGGPSRPDQTIVIRDGKIAGLGASSDTAVPTGATVLDLTGKSVIPGLVMLHEHLYYPTGPGVYGQLGMSFVRLYLAGGVTTMRTGGNANGVMDISLKQKIDRGEIAGPAIDATAPYLEGPNSSIAQMHVLKDADDARKQVAHWADMGATSFKAYMNITRAELRAAVEEAHKRGLKVTGHLCSIGFREAAEIGIDDLEHGLLVDSEFVPNKQPDQCPAGSAVTSSLRQLDISGAALRETIHTLVAKNVAVTSTLPVFEAGAPLTQSGIGAATAVLNPRVLNVMSTEARARYLAARARISSDSPYAQLLRKEMDFERAFVQAGGLLLAGPDPTGNGGVVAGFGDLREVELLVEAGFTPLEAIKIASFNGARFLGEDAHIGSIAAGKQADLILVKGNPAVNIGDIEKVEIVFKNGIGYDSEKLIQSVQGLVGTR